MSGANAGIGERLPMYLLAGAAGFVGALLYRRSSPQEGTAVLRGATAIGCVGVVGIGLGTEAVTYGLIHVVPALSVYLASVGSSTGASATAAPSTVWPDLGNSFLAGTLPGITASALTTQYLFERVSNSTRL